MQTDAAKQGSAGGNRGLMALAGAVPEEGASRHLRGMNARTLAMGAPVTASFIGLLLLGRGALARDDEADPAPPPVEDDDAIDEPPVMLRVVEPGDALPPGATGGAVVVPNSLLDAGDVIDPEALTRLAGDPALRSGGGDGAPQSATAPAPVEVEGEPADSSGLGETGITFGVTTLALPEFPEPSPFPEEDLGDIGETVRAGDDGGELIGTDADDNLEGGAGDDIIRGLGGDDVIRGGAGNDVLDGGEGDDQLFGEEGDDELLGGAGNDVLDGGAGDDLLKAGKGNNTLIGGAGDDRLEAGAEIDQLEGGPGDDTLVVNHFADIATDAVEGPDGGGNDTLEIGQGWSQSLQRDHPEDAPEGSATFFIGGVVSTVVSDRLNDFPQQVHQGIENVHLTGDAAHHVVGDGRDNVITGNGADNIFYGGGGADRIEGGGGDDRYLLGLGEGMTTIADSEGVNRLAVLDDDVDLADFRAEAEGDDLVLAHNGTPFARIENYTANPEAFSGIEIAGTLFGREFIDGAPEPSPFPEENLGDRGVTIEAGDDGAELVGTDKADWLLGGAGDDTIFGRGGNDILHGGAGDDELIAGTGNNQLFGEEGNDILRGGPGNDVLDGGPGDDLLIAGEGNNRLIGGAGDDRLVAGPDIDQLEGGPGDDTLVVNHFADIATDAVGDQDDDGGNDTLEVGQSWAESLKRGLPQLSPEGTATFVIGGLLATDIPDGLNSFPQRVHEGIENVHLTGDAAHHVIGDARDNVIIGNDADNILYGGGGNDRIEGGGSDDTYLLRVGEGVTTIADSEGVNRLVVLDDDVDPADFRADRDGDDLVLAHNDTAFARIENRAANPEAFSGIAIAGTAVDLDALGEETETGPADDEQASVAPDDPQPDETEGSPDGSEDDEPPVPPASDVDEPDGSEESRSDAAPSDPADEETGDAGAPVPEEVVRQEIVGTNGADTIQGGPEAELIRARGGDDVVRGGTGDDIIEGGPGDDLLDGGEGDDLLVAGEGDNRLFGGPGNDRLEAGSGVDRLEGGPGDDTVVIQNHRDFATDTGGGNDTLEVGEGWAASLKRAFPQLAPEGAATFMMGGVLASELPQNANAFRQQVHEGIENVRVTGDAGHDIVGNDRANAIFGNDGDNILFGGGGDDRIEAGAGNDTLFAGPGDDIVYGGAGDDMLYGDAGDDTFLIGLEEEDGVDTVFDHEGANRLEVTEEDAEPDRFAARMEGDDLVLAHDGVDVVRIDDHAGNPEAVAEVAIGGETRTLDSFLAEEVSEPTAAGGDDLLGAFLDGPTMTGSEVGDILAGTEGPDWIEGRGGNDILDGRAGDDRLAGGDGSDALRGGAGDDAYLFERGESGADTVRDSEGVNRLELKGYEADMLNGFMAGSDLWISADEQPVVMIEGYAGNEQAWSGARADDKSLSVRELTG